MTIHNKRHQIKSLPLQRCNCDVDIGPVLQGYRQKGEKTKHWAMDNTDKLPLFILS